MNAKTRLKMTAAAVVVCISLKGVRVDEANADTLAKPSPVQSLSLDSLEGLEVKAVSETGAEPVRVKADIANYNGRRALHVVNDDSTMGSAGPSGGESLTIVKGSDFKDGTIKLGWDAAPRIEQPEPRVRWNRVSHSRRCRQV